MPRSRHYLLEEQPGCEPRVLMRADLTADEAREDQRLIDQKELPRRWLPAGEARAVLEEYYRALAAPTQEEVAA